MKKSWNRVLALLCVLALCVGLVPAALAARPMGDETVEAVPAAAPAPAKAKTPAEEPAELLDTHTVWIVGDSTACHYDPAKDDTGYFYKRMGYGDQVQTYLASGYTVNNLALSGRSSKSFLSETNYTTLTGASGMKSGDILIIGWGHNDEKNDDAARFTDASKAYTVEGSFGYSINENYIKPAQAKGVKVILCTPIVRLPSGDSFGANDLHDCSSKGIGNYAQAIKDLGAAVNVPVVDLTTLTKDKWTAMGLTPESYEKDEENPALATTKNNGAYALHAWSQGLPKYADHTHINSYGAKWVAYMLANAIVTSTDASVTSDLKAAFSTAAGAPTAADLTAAAVENWKWPTYKAPNMPTDKSSVWANFTVGEASFYGSAFGSLSSNVTDNKYVIEPKDGKMHLAFTNQKGKITAGEEGFLMYFYPVPADKTFSLSARVTLNGFASDGTNPQQAAFGLMARDAMWIDQSNDKALMSDYVVAGTLGNGGPNCFRRKAGTLETNIATLKTETVEAGKSYNVSIVGNGDGYTCTFGKETPQSGGYDYSLTSTDGEYVYVGMMACRSVDVTYDNIYFVVDGQVVMDTREPAFDVDKWTFKDAKGAETADGKPAQGGTLASIDLDIALQEDDEVAAVAVYNTDGKMTGIKLVPLKNLQPGKVDLGLAMNPGDTVKVIHMDAKATLKPVGDKPAIVLETQPVEEGALTGAVGDKWDFAASDFTDDRYSSEENTDVADWTCPNYHGLAFGGGAKKEHTHETQGPKQHVQMGEGGTITVPVAGKCNVEVTYTWAANAKISTGASDANAVTTVMASNSATTGENPAVYRYNSTQAGTVTIAASGTTFVTKIEIKTYTEPTPVTPPTPVETGKIKVWDFGGVAESDTDIYENMITDAVIEGAKLTTGNTQFNGTFDLAGVIFKDSSGRLYTSVKESSWPNSGKNFGVDKTFEGDSYVSKGGIYAGGTGDASKRYLIIRNVKAGDKIVAYMGTTNTTAPTFNAGSINSKDDSASVKEYSDDTVAAQAFVRKDYIASKDGDFKIWCTGKVFYCRVVQMKPATVTGTITLKDNASSLTGYGLRFINKTTKDQIDAVIEGNTYTAKLTPGYTYSISVTGVLGYGCTNTTNTLAVTDAESVTGKTANLELEAKTTYTYSGKVTGFANDYDTSRVAVTLVPDEDSAASGIQEVELDLGNDLSYSQLLEPTVEYTVKLDGADDYKITAGGTVTSSGTPLAQNITVAAKDTHQASGSFELLDADDMFAPIKTNGTYGAFKNEVTKLTFTILDETGKPDANYVYEATVTNDATNGGSYQINLRPGTYRATATVNGYTTKTNVVMGDKAVTKNLLFKETAPAGVDYAADIYVNPAKTGSETDPTFKTVTGALAYVERMDRSLTEAENAMVPKPVAPKRVTIHVEPGVYREQINVSRNCNNVSIVNAAAERNPGSYGQVLFTWYYGIGYKYYSVGDDGWYDAERAYDKVSKPAGDVSRWGATVRMCATGFLMENIDMESSFNRYMTDEELVDGVEVNGAQKITFAREYGADVNSKDATERAAAIWVDTNTAGTSEFFNCKFMSSQDTLGTGAKMYLKNCFIEGMTDYICGPGDCVFDSCVLSWKGYSDKDKAYTGYITAPQTTANGKFANEKGYLFRNCLVTGNPDLPYAAGSFGRTWGGAATKCYFMDTILDTTANNGASLINNDDVWHTMQGFAIETVNDTGKYPTPDSVTIQEHNTMLRDGTKVNTSTRGTTKEDANKTVVRCPNLVMSDDKAKTISAKSYFGDWTPVHYQDPESDVGFDASGITVSSNNVDISTITGGHTLTVNYTLTPAANNANDASTIEWYAISAANAPETSDDLVKKVVGAADKTYQVQRTDVGKYIKVKVTPKTIGGEPGTAASYTVQYAVADGWEIPGSFTDPELGEGVNVFLAGDSTLVNYSATGMWNTGSIIKEGSWGEFLPEYLDKDLVTVVNYAHGGQSTRTFINYTNNNKNPDGSLGSIYKAMKAGDYLFVQFGHNDSSNSDDTYVVDRYVPLGVKGSDNRAGLEGHYPVFAPTVNSGKDPWDPTNNYTWDCGATYKWYLLQYVKVALAKGGTAVLMTPVSRINSGLNTSGTITPHHAEDKVYTAENMLNKANWTANTKTENTYCVAVKELYDEIQAGTWDTEIGGTSKRANVKYLDSFTLTKEFYEGTYAPSGNNNVLTRQLFFKDSTKEDGTHASKLGGVIQAALIAKWVQDADLSISKTVKAPTQVLGKTHTGATAFTIDSNSVLTAYDINKDYSQDAADRCTYWENWAATQYAAISAKRATLNAVAP